MSKIVLIDGHSILNRAFFGLPDLTNAEGLHTNAIYGFLNIMFKILEEEKPEYLTVAFDVHAPTFRHKMFEAYKGTRKPMAEELRQQVPLMKEVLHAMGIRTIEQEGLEADDLLGTLSKRCERIGMEVVIISGDRDLLQLATDHVEIRIPKTKRTGTEIENYYAVDVKEKYQVTPTEFIDVKALMGDTSDNIPGVPGVGEKTATKIIVEYGSIENAYKHASELKPPRASKNLVEYWDQAQMSKVLATIDVDADFAYELEEAKLGNLYTEEAYVYFQRLQFKNLLNRFDVQSENSIEDAFVIAVGKEEIQKIFAEAEKAQTVGAVLYKDTRNVLPLFAGNAEIGGIGISFGKEKIYCIPAGNGYSMEELLEALVHVAKHAGRFVVFDLKSSLPYLKGLEGAAEEKCFDSIVAAYLLNPLKNDYGFEDVAQEHLGLMIDPKTELEKMVCYEAYAAFASSAVLEEKLKKEISRFKNSMQSPAEAGVIRTYIETMLEMPWNKRAEDFTDIAYAKELLEAEHYGLEEVKERVLEFLAVRALTKKGDSPILCLVGPPGTGKTSIARSLAKALKKPYVRISLGGVRDEAEIRGHRKTYVGAMPGRIANGIKSAGVKNPLLLLDEIDKVSTDYKGDTFSALLEVLDSEQNNRFRDHYLEVPVDLSEVTFVTTANSLQTIPRPLLDRMEVIEVSSYTENEKLHIATEHLIPKQLERHGLTKEQLTISKGVIWKIAQNYTKEAGVRQMEREIGNICRKAAREIYEHDKKRVQVTERNIEKYLGKEKYTYQMANAEDEVGIVRGLAWTSVGGDTLQIEVNVMPGKGEIILTGQLGDVMKESAQAGISYIRSISSKYKVAEDFFEKHDIHIHIPEGAVPKDGPSAGITMATAMFSAITDKKVRADLAMTGEITLRGRVLPIGGLKEKLLAAKNAGIRTVLVPRENKKDVDELSSEITKGLEIIPVSQMEEVLKIALVRTRRKKDGN